MTRRLPKYVSEFKDRHGKIRLRFRRKGQKDHYFKSVAWSKEFMQEYQACIEGNLAEFLECGRSRTLPGSFDQLISIYYGSPEFECLSPSTKTTYRGIIERFRAEYGKFSVKGMKREHVRAVLAKKRSTPAAANNLLRMIRMLMGYAMDAGFREDDPTYGIKTIKIKSEGFPAWNDSDVKQFEEIHPIGSKARLALALLLYTGQRRSDVVRMGWTDVNNENQIKVTQQKTKVKLEIPMHSELKRVLDSTKKDHITFIVTEYGQPFTAPGFGNWFRKQCLKAGIHDKSSHGLRKTAARRLAEAGCTPTEIMAITGHQSIKEVDRYTKSVDQQKMGLSAMAKLEKTANDV